MLQCMKRTQEKKKNTQSRNETKPPAPPVELCCSLVEDPVLEVLDGLVLLHLGVLVALNLKQTVQIRKYTARDQFFRLLFLAIFIILL